MATKPASNLLTLSGIEREAFVPGVALFDEMLREFERFIRAGFESCLVADMREATTLQLYAKPYLERLIARPELMAGFAGALGDYVGNVQLGCAPEPGDQYTGLSHADIFGEDASPLPVVAWVD